MKSLKHLILLGLSAFLLVQVSINFISCTHDDQEVPEFNPPDDSNPSELISLRTAVAPTIDGTVDLAWDNAAKLFTATEVPDLANAVFAGYEGDRNEVTLRSMYDDEHIYFLAEWADAQQSYNRQTWYFNTDDEAWKQELRIPEFNENGVIIREPFYEDKFAFLFNANNSVANWNTQTCWASCHTDLSSADGFARHFTQAGETIDMWHWKSVRTDINNQMDDQFQNDTQPNGRHSDAKESGGYTNNVQELTITGTTTVVKVPKYFIPTKTYYYWITQSEIDNGTAKLITSVDANGILGYDGGAIDPTDSDFQRDGSTTGAKCIPSIYTAPFVGSRADLEARGVFEGSGWTLEIKRKLQTDDVANEDVDFSSLETLPFGIAVFDNAGIAHGIKAGLTLKFAE